MDNQQHKSRKRKENWLLTGDKPSRKSVIAGSLIATVIALTPFLYSLHESVPSTQVWDTFLFTYDSGFWEDARYAMWVFTGKIIPLMLLTVWFFTCRHWWYHAILVPIIMYIFQIIVSYNAEVKFVDEFQFIYLLPVMAIVIPSIYLIRARMFNKMNQVNKSMEELEEEFMIKPKGFFEKIKQYF